MRKGFVIAYSLILCLLVVLYLIGARHGTIYGFIAMAPVLVVSLGFLPIALRHN